MCLLGQTPLSAKEVNTSEVSWEAAPWAGGWQAGVPSRWGKWETLPLGVTLMKLVVIEVVADSSNPADASNSSNPDGWLLVAYEFFTARS